MIKETKYIIALESQIIIKNDQVSYEMYVVMYKTKECKFAYFNRLKIFLKITQPWHYN